MGKFTSYDGVDAQGIRAEVNVQTGTGRIKELTGRGRQGEDGTFRNVEVVFDPDNPKLMRKVYALLDTTAKELWDYVQKAHAEGRDVSYRIESQRKRGVDRNTKFNDLKHTEEVVRVLAGIDGLYSHEAKTNPAEDPSAENPSALEQAQSGSPAPTAAVVAAAGAPQDPAALLGSLAAARRAGLPATTVDTLMALALAAGAGVDAVLSAGLDAVDSGAPAVQAGRAVASEEKPWMAYNSDGRINVGSFMVAHAATAERFALDHLVTVYSGGKKSPVDVSDAMIAQAAAVALVLLEMADQVLVDAVGGRPDRQKNSYNRCLALVLEAVEKRHPVPVGGNDEAKEAWRTVVVREAAERLYGVTEVAQGRIPLPEAERPAVAAPAAAPVETAPAPAEPASDFEVPSDELIGRMRDLCVSAGVGSMAKEISDWLERELGVRATRKVHAPRLEEFVSRYEGLGADAVRAQVEGSAAA